MAIHRWLGFFVILSGAAAQNCGAPSRVRSAPERPPAPAAQGRAPESAPAPADAPAPGSKAALVERGRYLVTHVAGCADCHSPKTAERQPDPARWLAGADCFVDAVPADPALGCLSTANLTNHETGLLNRTDRQIKDMFLRGVRPDGKALHPFMPYAYFGNMREADADAIVAYLRTVPGVDHTVTPSQAPFLPPKAPVPRVPEALIPLPRTDYLERESALRGRYLAGNIGSCLACHTPRGPERPLFERAFQGGLEFRREGLGLPATFPEVIRSPNLTPHQTGILGYSVADLVRALKHGEDPNQRGSRLCPPMPAGPKGSLGGLSDADATDIAHYLLSLSPAEHAIPDDCRGPSLAGPHATNDQNSEIVRRLAPFVGSPDDARLGALRLSELGLYADIATKRVASSLRAFEPAYPLFSDGARKQRWLSVPAGTRIDSSDPAHWSFPVGTLSFKEFSLAGRRVETRVVARTGPGAGDYFMGAFVWNDDESDALFTPGGKLLGAYEVPSAERCWSCHGGEPGRVLGFSAVQQPDVPSELLSAPPTRRFVPPGDDKTRQALGYLHANCGHCHNPHGSARPDTDLDLALRPGDTGVSETGAYRSAVGRPLTAFRSPRHTLRVAAGAPDASALLYRMSEPAPDLRMPPFAATHVDAAGAAVVRRWIAGL